MNKTDYYEDYPEHEKQEYIINEEKSILITKTHNFHRSYPVVICFCLFAYFGVATWIGLCFIPSIHHSNNSHIICPKFTLI